MTEPPERPGSGGPDDPAPTPEGDPDPREGPADEEARTSREGAVRRAPSGPPARSVAEEVERLLERLRASGVPAETVEEGLRRALAERTPPAGRRRSTFGELAALRLVSSARRALYGLAAFGLTLIAATYAADLTGSEGILTLGEYVGAMGLVAITGAGGVCFHLAEDLLREERDEPE